MALRLYLIRHAETAWNREGRCQGKSDLPLSEQGVAQARALAKRLGPLALQAVYSSPLARAVATAKAIAAPHGLQVETREAFRELDQGELEGLRFEEIARDHGEFLRRWQEAPAGEKIPGGESLQELQARALPALEEIVSEHPAGNVVLVGHNLCNLTLLSFAAGLHLNDFRRLQQEVAALSVIEFGGKRPHPVLVRLNDTSHLSAED